MLESEFDELERRLVRLDSNLPYVRSGDEQEALRAMVDCVSELRRLTPLVEPLRQRYVGAGDDYEQAQAHHELRRVIHDVRTPGSVLYSYLQLINKGILFAHASNDQLAEVDALIAEVGRIRKERM